jgi:hypothetical protein
LPGAHLPGAHFPCPPRFALEVPAGAAETAALADGARGAATLAAPSVALAVAWTAAAPAVAVVVAATLAAPSVALVVAVDGASGSGFTGALGSQPSKLTVSANAISFAVGFIGGSQPSQ